MAKSLKPFGLRCPRTFKQRLCDFAIFFYLCLQRLDSQCLKVQTDIENSSIFVRAITTDYLVKEALIRIFD